MSKPYATSISHLFFFDVDGVIVDSEANHRRKNEIVAANHGGAIAPEDWAHLHGKGDRYIAGWLKDRFSGYALSVDEHIAKSTQAYMRTDGLAIRPGIVRTIRQLRTIKRQCDDIFMVVGTNGDAGTLNHNLSMAGLSRSHFDLVIDADTAKNMALPPKHMPEYYTHVTATALEISGKTFPNRDIRRVVVLEDSPANIRAAHQAGCTTIQWLHPHSMNVPAEPVADHMLQPDKSPYDLLVGRARLDTKSALRIA